MILANRIREARVGKKLTLKEVAERANISISYLSDLEHGRCNPSVDTLSILADIFHVSIDYIVGRANSPKGYLFFTEENGEFVPKEFDESELSEVEKEFATVGHKVRALGLPNMSKKESNDLIEAALIQKTFRQKETIRKMVKEVAKEVVEEIIDQKLSQLKETPADYPLAAHNKGDVDMDGLLRHVEERAKVVEERERRKKK